jgi:hypothetical protein
VLTILALCLAADPGDLARPIDLYELTVEDARKLQGCQVEVFLELGCPADVGNGFTVAGACEKNDGVERAVYLSGERHDLAAGDKLTASGTLRVVEHGDAVVNGVFVPGWTEIRVEQPRAIGKPGVTARPPSVGAPCGCPARPFSI